MTHKNHKHRNIAIHTARQQLSIDEDNYQLLLARFGAKQKNGRYSSTTLTKHNFHALMRFFESQGYQRAKSRPRVQKVRAQLAAYDLTDAYANAIARRMYGINSWRRLTDHQLAGLIAAIRKQQGATA